MMNIVKIQNGFILNDLEYIFKGENEIVSDTQCHIETDKGIILFDTNITVNGKSFNTIEELIKEIK